MGFLDGLEAAIQNYVLSNYNASSFISYAEGAHIDYKKINPKKFNSINAQELLRVANDFAEMLYQAQCRAYDENLGSGVGKRYIPFAKKPEISNDGLRMAVRVEYNGSVLHRPSYNPKSEGIDSIINLLNTGYKVPDGVYVPYKLVDSTRKNGKQRKMFARRERAPMGFIDDAIAEFKKKYPKYDIIPDESIRLVS